MWALRLLIPVIAGYVMDMIFGDPYWLPHPIRWIGTLISLLEHLLRRIFPAGKRGERTAGILLVILVVLCSAGSAILLLWLCYSVSLVLGLVVESVLCYQMLATKCLKTESMKVSRALSQGDTAEARKAVSMIVGRDTDCLDEAGIVRAAIETVAENASDGSIAPLFYLVIGGAPLGVFYKAVNTMDSMVGYQNETYRYFGTAAAKLDDCLNLLPSRIAALAIVSSAFILRMGWKDSFRIWRRDHRKHKSPNSAQTEAACAGALGVSLAGDAVYFGKLLKKPVIGEAVRPVHHGLIGKANQLLYCSSAVCLVLFLAVKLLLVWRLL